jgi:hypothetical protein
MSTKRIVVITALGILLISAVIGAMFLNSFLGRDSNAIQLPDMSDPVDSPGGNEPDAIDRVVVTPDTIQAVISTLDRPPVYSREVVIERFWSGGSAENIIDVYVSNGITSLHSTSPSGLEKRIIVTSDTLYIWYRGDSDFFAGTIASTGDGNRTADEWQMIVTYEDILALNKSDIIDAGYTEYEGELCVYAVYASPLLGYTRTYYISLEIGLVIAAFEYDSDGIQVYGMIAGESFIGEIDPLMFTLPDGTDLIGGFE